MQSFQQRVDALKERYCDIPASLRQARRWLFWRSEPRGEGKKARKIPCYASGKRRGFGIELDSSDDRAQLSDFEQALVGLVHHEGAGLGFALGPDERGKFWQGIDLDDVASHGEQMAHIVDALPGYTEISPSGKGAHAIGYGRQFAPLASNASGIEAYSCGRFFTVTGEGVGRGDISDLADFVCVSLVPVHRAAGGTPTAELSNEAGGHEAERAELPTVEDVDPRTVVDLRSALTIIPSDDRAMWIGMMMALKTIGSAGLSLFHEWSQRSKKYDAADAQETWDSAQPSRTSYEAVFAEAQRRGWVNPRSNAAQLIAALPDTSPHAWAPKAFKFVDAATLLANYKPVAYLLDGLIESEATCAIFGAPGAGKSFAALALSACIATGQPCWGRKTRQGAVFYIAGEGHAGITRRLRAWTLETKIGLNGAPLYISEAPAAIMDLESAQAVEKAVAERMAVVGAASLIVVDTLARNMGGGDENSTADMSLFVQRMTQMQRALGCTVLIVHHSGVADKGRMRGSSALHGAVDSEFMVGMEGPGQVCLTHVKSKESELHAPIAMRLKRVVLDWLDAEGRPMESAVLLLSDEHDRESGDERLPKRLPPKLRFGLEAFIVVAVERGQRSGGRVAVHVDDWRDHFVRTHHADNPAARRKAFSRALKDLVEGGHLQVDGQDYSLPDTNDALIAQYLLRPKHPVSSPWDVEDRDDPS